jgi:hypothetical protein
LVSGFHRCGCKRDIRSMSRSVDLLLLKPTNLCFGTNYPSHFKGQTIQEEFNCSWM